MKHFNFKKKAVLVILTAAALSAAACGGSKKSAETTAAETTETAVTIADETTTAAASSETAESTTSAETKAAQVTAGKLTEFLGEINDNFSDGGSAGISLRAAKEAAELMSWYMDEKPTGDAVMRETENYARTVSDKDAFQSALEMISQSALDTVSAEGQGLLADAGWNGKVTWTENDVNSLFNAIFEGTGQKK